MTQQTAADFDREPKTTTLEMSAELGGREGLMKVDASELTGEVFLRIENLHGSTSLFLSDLDAIIEYAQRYKVALHAVRGTQP